MGMSSGYFSKFGSTHHSRFVGCVNSNRRLRFTGTSVSLNSVLHFGHWICIPFILSLRQSMAGNLNSLAVIDSLAALVAFDTDAIVPVQFAVGAAVCTFAIVYWLIALVAYF